MSARLGRIALIAAGLAVVGAALVAVWPPSKVAQGPLDEAVAPTAAETVRVPVPDPPEAQLPPAAAREASVFPFGPAAVSPTGASSLVDPAFEETALREPTGSGPTWAGPEDAYMQPGEAELDASPTNASPEAVGGESYPAMPMDSHPTSLPSGGYADGSLDAPAARPESSPTGAMDSSELPGQ